eukprot:13421859-Alexandrium_andersonii.AAC.1
MPSVPRSSRGLVAESFKQRQAIEAKIKDLLIDVGPFVKGSSKLPELVGYAGRAPLMQELKAMNGVDGKGLRLLGRLILALSGSGVKTAEGMIIDAVRAEVIAMRQKGRMLLCLRTAAGIIMGKKADEVEKLQQEVKKLK